MSGVRLDLSIPPDWAYIDPAREAVGILAFAMTQDDNLREALAMVSEELLENAIKYSKPDTAVSLSLRDGETGVIIAVTNAVEEASSHAQVLGERVAWMRGFSTALDAYTAAMTRVYRRENSGDAGLGIVRIAYEGRCGVDVDLSEPGLVTVRAACRLG